MSSTSFVILELTGDQNNLVLNGRALPYRPFTLEGGMRIETTWYPGNPVATVQMLGADEKTTTIGGTWKDRFIRTIGAFGIAVAGGEGVAEYNGQRVADVMSLVRVVEGFRLRGQLLEVGWDELIRQGILTRFRQSWLRREDVEWEMEFQWIARGEPILPVAFSPAFNVTDVYNAIRDAVDAVASAVEEVFALVSAIRNAISEALAIIEEAVAAIGSVADMVADLVTAPLEAAKTVLASVQTIKDQARSIYDAMESIPARAQRQAADLASSARRLAGAEEDAANATTVDGEGIGAGAGGTGGGAGGISGAGGSEVAQSARVDRARDEAVSARSQGIDGITHEEALEAEKYKRDVRSAARNLRTVASQYEDQLASKTTNVPRVETYAVREDQDLRDLSTRFYGTPDEWKRLLSYNNLSTSRMAAGQIVLVPPLSTLRGS